MRKSLTEETLVITIVSGSRTCFKIRSVAAKHQPSRKHMELNDSQIEYFVKNRLRLPQGERKGYLDQVDHLIEEFEAKLAEDPVWGVKKFMKTGSLKKGTVLRPADGCGVDADIAVFL